MSKYDRWPWPLVFTDEEYKFLLDIVHARSSTLFPIDEDLEKVEGIEDKLRKYLTTMPQKAPEKPQAERWMAGGGIIPQEDDEVLREVD